VLSREIRVTGVLNGAKVVISGGGLEVGSTTATVDGEVFVPLDTSLLVEKHYLGGTQTTTDGTSEPTGYVVQITGVSLDPPILKSILHTCMTDVLVDGCTPGATLVTKINGVAFGETLVSKTLQWCGIDQSHSIPADSTIEIHQEATVNQQLQTGTSSKLPAHSCFLRPG
jgi:hypothetical protein